jgi:hypothetical protein
MLADSTPIAIVGPPGIGKSVLLQALCALHPGATLVVFDATIRPRRTGVLAIDTAEPWSEATWRDIYALYKDFPERGIVVGSRVPPQVDGFRTFRLQGMSADDAALLLRTRAPNARFEDAWSPRGSMVFHWRSRLPRPGYHFSVRARRRSTSPSNCQSVVTVQHPARTVRSRPRCEQRPQSCRQVPKRQRTSWRAYRTGSRLATQARPWTRSSRRHLPHLIS